jgi:hypothetical protein
MMRPHPNHAGETNRAGQGDEMTIRSIAIALTAWLACACGGPPETSTNSDVTASVSADAVLTFTVEWHGATPLRIDEADLPWSPVALSHGTLVLIVSAARGETLERTLSIVDPGDLKVVLERGRPLSGQIRLVDEFEGLERMRAEQELLIFWAYKPMRAPIPRAGGWLPLPRAAR